MSKDPKAVMVEITTTLQPSEPERYDEARAILKAIGFDGGLWEHKASFDIVTMLSRAETRGVIRGAKMAYGAQPAEVPRTRAAYEVGHATAMDSLRACVDRGAMDCDTTPEHLATEALARLGELYDVTKYAVSLLALVKEQMTPKDSASESDRSHLAWTVNALDEAIGRLK